MGNIADTTTQATLFRRIRRDFRCFQMWHRHSCLCPSRVIKIQANHAYVGAFTSIHAVCSPLLRSAQPPPSQLLPYQLRLKLSS